MNNPLFRLGGLCSVLWASLLSAGCDGDPAAEPDRGLVDMIQPGCTEGERRCDAAGRPEVCASGAWASEAACGEGQSCVDGACAADRVCEPGTSRCADPTTIEVCDAEGEGWDPSPCLDGQCRDVDGAAACSELECVPGMRRCNGEQVIVECSADGTRYDFVETCNGARTGRQCDRGECVELCVLNEKVKTNIGCDYWAADLDNALVPGGDGFLNAARAPYAIVVSNPHPDFTAEVSIYNVDGLVVLDSGAPAQALVPPLGLHVFNLPHRDIDGTGITPRAYRVRSSIPIIAYQFNPLDNEEVFSNDASLLLPSHVLGDEYYVMTREQSFARLRGFLTVIAIGEEPTTVDVTVTAQTQPGPGIPAMVAGESFRAVLQPFEVLNIESGAPGADLTGSYITASADVVVFGGSEAANVPNTNHCINVDPITGEGVCEASLLDSAIPLTPCRDNYDCNSAGLNTCCADHLEQQMFPLKTWGSSYIASKSWDRGLSKDIYRIMAGEDNTRVVLVPPQPGVTVPILNAGEYFEFESASNFEIHAQNGKPILVGQFLAAQDAPDPNVGGVGTTGDAGVGDPGFLLLIPVEQYRTDFVVLTPSEYADNYLNVTVPTGAQVEVDGEEISPGFFTLIGSGEYSVYRRHVPPGTHTIRSSEPAGVIVYGWDQYVSYAYTGGLDLEEIRKETPFTDQVEEE